MFQLKRILFPVDFSERCRGASVYVEALASHFEAELILLHVVEPPTYNTSLADSHPIQPESFDRFFGALFQHLHIKRLTEHGEAARRIVETAAQHHADLIMIPTQGMGIYRRLIIGSTSAKVLHDADCPVWTSTHLEEPRTVTEASCRRILCAVDLKPSSTRVLEWANHLAQAYQAELTVLHVAGGSEAHRTLEELMKRSGARGAGRIEHGDPVKVVAHVAAAEHADLLIIGRRATEGILGRLEMTAYSIIRESPCPVVSV